MKVRTRIAPSPTGPLHIGNFRTSLFNYAFAKKFNGQFIIRIEDTDRERYLEKAVEEVIFLHDFFGLEWDEGPDKEGDFGPYVQSERLDIYHKHAEELVEKGKAYHCFCTKERLKELKAQQQKSGLPVTKYDKKCLSLTSDEIEEKLKKEEDHVIRLNVPKDQEIIWVDENYGEIKVPSNDIDDQVLIKSDGFPTYHLAVVVDDHLMNVSHVLRGNDWIPSTPKHILLYEYLGWEKPKFVHLPNLKEMEGTSKLSKRQGSVSVMDFLLDGYLPEVLLNFLMFLGWNPGTDKEIYSLEEFVHDFSIEKLHKADLVSFDREKLLWMNGFYIRRMGDDQLLETIKSWAKDFEVDLSFIDDLDNKNLIKIIELVKDRVRVLSDFVKLTDFFFHEPKVDVDLLNKFTNDKEKTRNILQGFLSEFKNIRDWNVDEIEKISKNFVKGSNYSTKEAFMTLRIALTGKEATPPLFEIMEVLGNKETVSRIEKSVNY